MKRIIGAALVLTMASFLAVRAQAQPVAGTNMISLVQAGSNWYIPVRTDSDTVINRVYGEIGVVWDEPVYLTSMSMTIFNDPGDPRAIPETIRLYTAPDTFYDVPFTPKMAGTTYGEYVLNFGQSIPAVNSYVVVAFRKEDTLPGYHYNHIGLVVTGATSDAITFEAESMKKEKDVNLNSQLLGTTMSLSAGTPSTGTGVLGSVERTNNGDLVGNYSTNGILWNDSHNGQTVELIATYENVQTLGSIGLAFAGDDANRYCPALVTVIGTDENNKVIATMEDIPISIESALYGRYALSDDFVDVKHLILQFMVKDVPNGKWVGVHEFQAFGRPVPEPATMSLLALGGLALLRRRA